MIPKIFHRMWIGGEEPEWTRPFAKSWMEKNPEHSLVSWGNANVQSLFPLVNQKLYDNAEKLFPDHVWQFRSDLLRYEILYRHGGIWVDADAECVHPFDDLITDDIHFFAGWEKQNVWINNAILGAQKGHPLLFILIHGIEESVFNATKMRPSHVTGPRYLTKIWRRHAKTTATIFDQEVFYSYLWSDIGEDPKPNHRAFAIHHWNNARREKEKRK